MYFNQFQQAKTEVIHVKPPINLNALEHRIAKLEEVINHGESNNSSR